MAPLPPRVRINRRHVRVQRLLAHVIHVIGPSLKEGTMRDVVHELEDLFSTQGVDIITEGMRAEAGLPARDHDGLTLEELRIIEMRLLEGMMRPAPQIVMMHDISGEPAPEIKR